MLHCCLLGLGEGKLLSLNSDVTIVLWVATLNLERSRENQFAQNTGLSIIWQVYESPLAENHGRIHEERPTHRLLHNS